MNEGNQERDRREKQGRAISDGWAAHLLRYDCDGINLLISFECCQKLRTHVAWKVALPQVAQQFITREAIPAEHDVAVQTPDMPARLRFEALSELQSARKRSGHAARAVGAVLAGW